MRFPSLFTLSTLTVAVLLNGCRTAPTSYEQAARDQLDAVPREDYTADRRPDPSGLTAQSTPEDYLRFALLNHPAVAAAHANWRAAVERIAPARSLPDPKLTLQADIADTLMSLMPGIMFDFMSTGKRDAMGREAAAASSVARVQFDATIQEVALQLRKAWIELAYVDEARRLHFEAAHSIAQTLEFSSTEYSTGGRTTGLGAQIDLQDELALHRVHHANLHDRLRAAQIIFKSALGLRPADPDPAWPEFSIASETLPGEADLWQRLLVRNPDLAAMRAMVGQAVASADVAARAGTPDFGLGAMVDLKSSPLMVRPEASLSLPIWRNRIDAQIAAGRANRDAALADVDRTELDLAARLARSLYEIHRLDRLLRYYDQTALPNVDRLVAATTADYESGTGRGTAITTAATRRTLIRLEQIDLLRERADAVTDLLFLTADAAPSTNQN